VVEVLVDRVERVVDLEGTARLGEIADNVYVTIEVTGVIFGGVTRSRKVPTSREATFGVYPVAAVVGGPLPSESVNAVAAQTANGTQTCVAAGRNNAGASEACDTTANAPSPIGSHTYIALIAWICGKSALCI